jgi:beta-1,4-mannosyl-glycoprotein beta-1,4-N-acetylglucosaminyltransferase
VRYYKPKGLQGKLKKFWVNKFKTQILDDSGWHFTWMGGVDKIILKLESMVHQEFNLPEFKDPQKILQSIRTGQDIFGRNLFYKLQPIDHQFPQFLLSNIKDYEDWFLESQNVVKV